MLIALFHTLPSLILTAQSILCIGIILLGCFGKPLRRSHIILICSVAQGMHFTDSVLPVVLPLIGALPFVKGIQRFTEPFLSDCLVGITVQTIQIHFAQVVHRKAVTLFCFLCK